MSEWVMRFSDVQRIAKEIERTLHACGHHEAADICAHKFSDYQTIFAATFSDKKKARIVDGCGLPCDPDSVCNGRGEK